jgi:copper(I)-binding protein
MRRRDLLLAPLPLLLARAAWAHSYQLGAIEIGHPWARPSVTGAAAAFLALGNTGKASDRLIGGATPIADQVILRREDGVALDYLELLPRRPLLLRPGGKYLGLPHLKGLLALEDSFPLTLRFANAGEIDVTVTVEDGPEDSSINPRA